MAADLGDPAQLDAWPSRRARRRAGQQRRVLLVRADRGPRRGDLRRLFAANVRAPYFLVAAVAPKMAARGSGSIINIGSMAGQIGLAGGAAYGATKAPWRR